MISEGELFKYVEFLLPQYNCVIIPEFGGFIVNIESSKYYNGTILAPSYNIVFNPDLKHDDGILVSEIRKNYPNLSYNEIKHNIKILITNVKVFLNNQNILQCNNIGYLQLKDSNIGFTFNKKLVYPSFYGFSEIKLPLISTLIKNDTKLISSKSKKILASSRIIKSVAAVIIIILLFFPNHLSISSTQRTQEASMNIFNTKNSVNNEEIEKIKNDLNTHIDYNSSTINQSANPINTSTKKNHFFNKYNDNKTRWHHKSQYQTSYYIIIESNTNHMIIKELLHKAQLNGLNSSEVLKTDGRYRIYVNKFIDKKSTIIYYRNFKRNNPIYKTAWIYPHKEKIEQH